MKKTVFFFVVMSLLACKSQEVETASTGLLQPLKLEYDSTYLYPADYVYEAGEVLYLELPEGLESSFDSLNSRYLITGKMNKPLDVMHLAGKKFRVSLMLIRSFKQPCTISFPDPGKKHRDVQVAGSFNGWTASRSPMNYVEEKKAWEVRLILDEGLHPYRLHVDGTEMLDPQNKDSVSNGLGGYNSQLLVGESAEEAPFWYSELEENGDLMLASEQIPDEIFVLAGNTLLPLEKIIRDKKTRIPSTLYHSLKGRQSMRIFACRGGKLYNDLLFQLNDGQIISNSKALNRRDHHAMIMYFMMVDRFYDAIPENNAVPLDSVIDKAQFLGGDLKGISRKIEEGYFGQLGFNTVWISPISRNPDGAYGLWDKGGVRTRFSAYHGYWPVSFSQVDPRFGTLDDFRELIRLAHEKNSNVLLDYVAHHVHEESPLYQQHKDWATTLYLPDGSLNTERWDEYRLTTWFDVFLPTLDLARKEVYEAVTDSALHWFREYDLDGFRHDATKHVPTEYWRTLTYKVRREFLKGKDRSVYQIGETYGSHELIASYLGTGLLDAQFDFNLFDAAVQTFAFDADSATHVRRFDNLADALRQSIKYYGAHHLMGNISGNQDKPRFVSMADGSVRPDEDPKLAGYTRRIENRGTQAYERMKMMMAFNYLIPGVPIVYYGDEIGMPGANDPDNRRMMQFDSLSKEKQSLRDEVARLGKLRSENLALIYGDTRVYAQDGYFVVVRSYLGQHVIGIFTRSGFNGIPKLPSYVEASKLKKTGGTGAWNNGQIQLPVDSYCILSY